MHMRGFHTYRSRWPITKQMKNIDIWILANLYIILHYLYTYVVSLQYFSIFGDPEINSKDEEYPDYLCQQDSPWSYKIWVRGNFCEIVGTAKFLCWCQLILCSWAKTACEIHCCVFQSVPNFSKTTPDNNRSFFSKTEFFPFNHGDSNSTTDSSVATIFL